ncbi:MAG: alpha-glucosidase, partial [Salinivirgaceae bacterium]
ELSPLGEPVYTVLFKKDTVIKPSKLGVELKNSKSFDQDFEVVGVRKLSIEDTWEMQWGEQEEVLNNYNELIVDLKEKGEQGRKLNLYFRAYNDGIGFRYEFPRQEGIDSLYIMDENTEFRLTGDHTAWWIPGDWDIYEHLYKETKFTEINALADRGAQWLAQTYIPENAVNTPVTMRTESGLHLSFHEAALTDYSGMTLKIDPDNLSMTSELVGSMNYDYKAAVTLPFKTPWRTIQIAEQAKDLIASNLIVNLNEPNIIGDVSYFKPMKYNGIWWEMHLNKATWDMASGKHGATTENAKRYIDFAAENNLGGVLIEGWNTGWEQWIGVEDREDIFDFVTPYSDYDLKGVVEYAHSKGVEIIMHHETSAAVETYDRQMDTAYKLMSELGIHSVKTGYVGKIIPKGEFHHGQYMVKHYRKVLETAAKYNVAVNAHEPIKATGIRRTYPNAIAREGLRGQEFNAWATDGGNPPSHLPTIAFTRMLAGPIDYTPGIFNIKLDPYKPDNQVNTTLAQQLALYVVIYGPLQMAADLPESYKNQPAFQFIRDVGVDWAKSVVINGEVGDYVTIARKEKGTDNWFLGSITDENSREFEIALDFLDPDKIYHAIIYQDGKDAHWDDNPLSIEIVEQELKSTDKLPIKMAPGGGLAVSFIPK